MANSRLLGAEAIAGVFRHLLAVVDEHAVELNELDSIAGDGDLGVTMKLGMKGAVDTLPSRTNGADVGSLFIGAGTAFATQAPSTMGALLATGLRRAGQAAQGRQAVGLADAETMLSAAVEAIERRGGATLGDKTLLDVLIPFQRTLAARLASGTAGLEAVVDALANARDGLNATRKMVPRAGRSRWLAERSVGSLDAGAAAVYLLLEAATTRHLS